MLGTRRKICYAAPSGATHACQTRTDRRLLFKIPPPRSKKSRADTQLINKKHSYFYENISVKLFLTIKNTVLRITFRKNINFKVFKDFSQKTLRKLASAAQHRPQTLEKPPFPRDTPTSRHTFCQLAEKTKTPDCKKQSGVIRGVREIRTLEPLTRLTP